MRKISNQEFEELLDNGCGYTHFMGGTSSSNGQEVVDSSIGLFLFEKDEIGSEFYNECKGMQKIDAQEYLDGLNSDYI